MKTRVDKAANVAIKTASLPNVSATVEASRTYVCDVWPEGEEWSASVELSEAVYGGK